MMFGQELNSHRIFKVLAKALIRLTYVQADLRICWSHIPHCWKSHVAANIDWSDSGMCRLAWLHTGGNFNIFSLCCLIGL